MAQLLKAATAGCSNDVRADVFHMVATRYCREADTAKLAAMRQSLARDPSVDGSIDHERDTFLSMLDRKLAARRVMPPLQCLVEALKTSAGAHALDQACARLAVGLGLAGDAPDTRHAWLKDAVSQLDDSDLRALNDFVDREMRGVRKHDWNQPALPKYRSADVRERRDSLMRELRCAMQGAVRERVIRLVQSKSGDSGHTRHALRNLCTLVRSPDEPDRARDHALISSLCETQIRMLRDIARPLEPYGLGIDSQALMKEALIRSRPHEERAIAHVQELQQALAALDTDLFASGNTTADSAANNAMVGRIMCTLFDATRALQAAVETRASFVQTGTDDIAQLAVDVAQAAREAAAGTTTIGTTTIGTTTSNGTSTSTGISTDPCAGAAPYAMARPDIAALCESLAIGLKLASDSLLAKLDEEHDLEHMRAEQEPAGRASLLMRRASILALALAPAPSAAPVVGKPALDETKVRHAVDPGTDTPVEANNLQTAGTGKQRTAAIWPAVRQAVIDVFGVDYDPQSGIASTAAMSKEQHAELSRELVAESMPSATKEIRSVPLEANAPLAVDIEVDRQFILDGYDRPSVSFSAQGVSADGIYVPCVASTPCRGDTSHTQGMDRALLALHRVAGPDTAALTGYMSQIASIEAVLAFARMGRKSPLRLLNGDVVQLGDGGATETHVRRLADGSYELDQTVIWKPKMEGVLAIDSLGDAYSVALDLKQSHMALSYTVRLRIDADGKQTRQIAGPVDLRYSMRELPAQEDAGIGAFQQDVEERDSVDVAPVSPDNGFYGSSDESDAEKGSMGKNGA